MWPANFAAETFLKAFFFRLFQLPARRWQWQNVRQPWGPCRRSHSSGRLVCAGSRTWTPSATPSEISSSITLVSSSWKKVSLWATRPKTERIGFIKHPAVLSKRRCILIRDFPQLTRTFICSPPGTFTYFRKRSNLRIFIPNRFLLKYGSFGHIQFQLWRVRIDV